MSLRTNVLIAVAVMGVILCTHAKPPTLYDRLKRCNSYVAKTERTHRSWFSGTLSSRQSESTSESVQRIGALYVPWPGEPHVNTLGMEMAWIEPGKLSIPLPQNSVYGTTRPGLAVRNAFRIGVHEVTQAQFMAVMGSNPSFHRGRRRPVERVTWSEAYDFCEKLTKRERQQGELPDGWKYGLPWTEELEYASRAGVTTLYSFGEAISTTAANFDPRHQGCLPDGEIFRGETTGVGQFRPNSFGLFDTHGNVAEWCAETASRAPKDAMYSSASSFLTGPQECKNGVFTLKPGNERRRDQGFRVVLRMPVTKRY